MENASKALIMAASMLIGILILSLMVYLFASFASTASDTYKQKQEEQLRQFNTQFTSYENNGRITIYDVITIANLATENNIYYELNKKNDVVDDSDYYVGVYINTRDSASGWIEGGLNTELEDKREEYNQYIAKDVSILETPGATIPYYTCRTEISPATGRVYRVWFEKK